ncbi:uncharacterized protein PRCAT00003283001 [Priceomyces carsonii]|uniref:uncharacterized protein n=1 Tax=Priceomyces carsonii TaxID=28549 RepID=UPI002ED850CF|nr:unnamed protein product [Priceomyces carsonii]
MITSSRVMLPILFRLRFRNIKGILQSRCYSNIPFESDLTGVDLEDFGLQDFQSYTTPVEEKRDKIHKLTLLDPESVSAKTQTRKLEEVVHQKKPLVLISKLKNPYINLAIEDYVYSRMPLPENRDENFNRLLFYINSPCVVIGRNQNPWKEVNLPLLHSLHIPLVRRRSGGGTVVHDLGNINFSFMTSREKFDRQNFAGLVARAVNKVPEADYKLQVNAKGDIETERQSNALNYKVSGSAYKIAKGKSYHHGTMLLNLKLDILGKLLSRDEKKVGFVDSMSSVASIPSPVKNVGISSDRFIQVVTEEFKKVYGETMDVPEPPISQEKEFLDQEALFGFSEFINANSIEESLTTFIIDELVQLPSEVQNISSELRDWDYRYAYTPKFTHEFINHELGFKIKFFVGKKAVVEKFEIEFFDDVERSIPMQKIKDSFEFLESTVQSGNLKYQGSDVAGFITNDIISDWLGNSIDGTS